MLWLKCKYSYILIFFLLLSIQGYVIFTNKLKINSVFLVNNVASSELVNLFVPMMKESYADFSYIRTSISLWGVTNNKILKVMFGEFYKRNINSIVKLNPKLKDTYYMTEGHFHGINTDLNQFATTTLEKGFVNLVGYDYLWELYFMAGMNTYLYSDNEAAHYFKEAYNLTKKDKFLRLAEISKHKNGKLFVGLIMYKNLMEEEKERVIFNVYKDKFILYQTAWKMQKNVIIFIRDKHRRPESLDEISKFVNVNLKELKYNLLKYNLYISFDNKTDVISVTLNETKRLFIEK